MSKVLVLKPVFWQGTHNLISCPIILLNNGAKKHLRDEITVRDLAANPIPVLDGELVGALRPSGCAADSASAGSAGAFR